MLVVIPEIIIGLAARGGSVVNNPNTIFYDLLHATAPEWFFPILLVSIFAAFMSTLDSSLFAISSQLGKYGFIVKKKTSEANHEKSTNEKIANRTRFWIITVLILALIASLFFGSFIKGVFDLISLLTVMSVTLLLGVILRLNSNEIFIAALMGLAVFLIAFFGGFITSKAYTTLYPSAVLTGYIALQTISIKIYKRFHSSDL